MDLVFRAIVLFFGVYVLLRVVGRRELAQMEPFDFILLIVLGDAIQQGLTQDDYSVTGAMIVVGAIASLQVATSYLSFKSRWARRALNGDPIVIVQDGKVIEGNLRRERLTVEEVAEEARGQQIASLDDVRWAVFEPSGKINFISKQ